jgi:hypothetical protein
MDSTNVVLEREGEVWAVSTGARTFFLRDRVGLRYLARLLAEPNRELCVLELAGALGADRGDAGELLDAAAIACYKRRLAELAEAEESPDELRAARARAEREMLAEEIARAVGLGGRARRGASNLERARVAVTRRIRDAIDRIAAQDAAAGRYLDRAIRTGRFCCYRADAAA